MGDFISKLPAVIEKIGAFFNGIVAHGVALIPQPIVDFYNTHTVLCILALVCVLALIAFEGYRFFRMLTYAGSAFLFGLVGYWYLAPAIADSVKPMVPEYLDYYAIVAVVCALVAVLLCHFAFNFVILIIGGFAGYFIGSTTLYGYLVSYFNTLEFLKGDNVKHIVGGIVAVIIAILFSILFKFLFMVLTSFGGCIGAAVLLQKILVPGGDDKIKMAFLVIGVIVGFIAIIRQHKEHENTVFRI